MNPIRKLTERLTDLSRRVYYDENPFTEAKVIDKARDGTLILDDGQGGCVLIGPKANVRVGQMIRLGTQQPQSNVFTLPQPTLHISNLPPFPLGEPPGGGGSEGTTGGHELPPAPIGGVAPPPISGGGIVSCMTPARATVHGGATIHIGESAEIYVDMGGYASGTPWTITWSDGFVQVTSEIGLVTRTVSPTETTVYTATISTTCAGMRIPGFMTGSATITVLPTVFRYCERSGDPHNLIIASEIVPLSQDFGAGTWTAHVYDSPTPGPQVFSEKKPGIIGVSNLTGSFIAGGHIGPANNVMRWTLGADYDLAFEINNTDFREYAVTIIPSKPDLSPGTWSIVSGTGTIVDPTENPVRVRDIGPGEVHLRWEGSYVRDIFVTVDIGAAAIGTTHTFHAIGDGSGITGWGGNDPNVVGVHMGGASPTPGHWTQILATGYESDALTFTDPTSPTSAVTKATAWGYGRWKCRWTVDDPDFACSGTDAYKDTEIDIDFTLPG